MKSLNILLCYFIAILFQNNVDSISVYSKINRIESASRTWSSGSTKPFRIKSIVLPYQNYFPVFDASPQAPTPPLTIKGDNTRF